jgi:hypothetical protein
MGDRDEHAPLTHEGAIKALGQLFSDPRIRGHAHFRYSLDGPTDVEKAFDEALKVAFGPRCNKKHEAWVKRLRGLIG